MSHDAQGTATDLIYMSRFMIHSLIQIVDVFGANCMRRCYGSHVVFAFVHICNVVKSTSRNPCFEVCALQMALKLHYGFC